ncbi:MAG: hypothetical protein IJ455_07010 [Agathobacter sp.]|nr:hypothetical protein [Agathobacter sp.]
MKKVMKRVFAILMTLAIAITALPMMEVKAAEGDIVIQSVTLPDVTVTVDDTNPRPVYEGAELVLSSGYENVKRIYGYYRHTETGSGNVGVWFYKTETDGVYEGSLNGRPYMDDGTYELYSMSIVYEDDTEIYLDSGFPASSFNAVNNITDHTDPVILNPAFAQNGQTFIQGSNTKVEFTADLSDEGLGLDNNLVYVTLKSVNGGIEWVYFEEQTDGSYKATFEVGSDVDNAEWYVSEYYACDKVGNSVYYYPMENGEYWHFYVEDAEGVCNTSRDITVNFYDEEDELIEEKKVTATSSEAVLADLLDEIPTYETELGFEGWECDETGQMLEEDTVFLAPYAENEFNFYPVTSKKYVEVDMKILDEDGDYSWTGYEPYLVDKDATYQDLIEILPTPESVNGANFVEWDLGGYELTDTIEYDSVDVWAVYDKQFIDLYYEYMDEDGEYAYKYTVLTFEVDEKVTYEKVLNKIPELKTYEGVTFVKWEILYEDITDLTQELEYSYVEAKAVYDKYPVTIDRTYVDTTGAVKNEKITKLYPAGTTMESIYDEYTVTPSDASSSLAITEWRVDEGAPEEVSAYNNMLVLTAQYGNESIVEVMYSYIAPFDDHGVVKFETVNIVVDNDIAVDAEALFNYCKQSVEDKINVTHYEACGFEGWEYISTSDTDEDGYIDSVSASSVIKEDEIIMLMAAVSIYSLDDFGLYVYVVEAGETIVLPWTYNDNYLVWFETGDDGYVEMDGYTYVVPKDAVNGDMFTVVAMEDEELPGEADTSVEIVDDNKVLPEGVVLRAILLEEGDVVTATETLLESKIKDINNLAIYDITLVNSKGVLIEELDNAIKVTLDIPFAIEAGSDIAVFRVDGDELVQCNASISGNKLSFVTDHFSTYVFVEQKAVPDTGDATNMIPYLAFMLLGAGVILVGSKKRNFVR